MKTAVIAKLKAHLSEYLVKVKAGEKVLVTDRGKPVARIVPLERVAADMPPHLLVLERAGLVRLGAGTIPKGFWQKKRPKDKKEAVLAGLLREREVADEVLVYVRHYSAINSTPCPIISSSPPADTPPGNPA